MKKEQEAEATVRQEREYARLQERAFRQWLLQIALNSSPDPDAGKILERAEAFRRWLTSETVN